MVITLVGYRGSGKTKVSELLAARLGWRSVDADDVIESRAGMSIREIFSEKGEPEFRRLERETMADLLGEDRLVIASGGGSILAESTRQLMREAGPVVWLRASVEELARRLSDDGNTIERRPQLTDQDAISEIAEVLAAREPLYREAATLVMETEGLTPADVTDAVMAALPADLGSDR